MTIFFQNLRHFIDTVLVYEEPYVWTIKDIFQPNIYLNTDLYEYIERAFVMPNPQIKFRLEFRQSIQYEGFTLTFNKPIENSELSYEDRFTLDCEPDTGIWNAYCEMVEIKNLRD